MNDDTVRIQRPMCCRRHEDLGGRIKQDPLGNIVRVKTRANDSRDEFELSWLGLRAELERNSAA
jgi:hypothetical protein